MNEKAEIEKIHNVSDKFEAESVETYEFMEGNRLEAGQNVSGNFEEGSVEIYEFMEGNKTEKIQNVAGKFEAGHDSTNELNKDDSVYLEM